MTKRILLDCDPGHDDALAILLAAGSPDVELVGITTVAGNQTLDKTTRNALVIATVGQIGDVPIVAGHDRPLLRKLRTSRGYHGESGLDGPPPITPDRAPTPGHAVEFIIETLMAHPGEITLVAVGPLTNVASALRREPRIAEAAQEVVIMGGAFGRGNVTQTAEFNIFVDPEAAAIVFGAPWSVTMLGLDLTHQAKCTEDIQRRIVELGSPVAEFTGQVLDFYRKAYRRQAGMNDPTPHDPCAVAYVIAPEIFETRPAAVDVELAGQWTAGTTVVDFGPTGDRQQVSHFDSNDFRHRVPVRLDSTAFFELVIDALGRLNNGTAD